MFVGLGDAIEKEITMWFRLKTVAWWSVYVVLSAVETAVTVMIMFLGLVLLVPGIITYIFCGTNIGLFILKAFVKPMEKLAEESDHFFLRTHALMGPLKPR